MVRTLKSDLEYKFKLELPAKSKTVAWMVLHATTPKNFGTSRSDGMSPHERWRGRERHMDRCMFRERVLFWFNVISYPRPLPPRRCQVTPPPSPRRCLAYEVLSSPPSSPPTVPGSEGPRSSGGCSGPPPPTTTTTRAKTI